MRGWALPAWVKASLNRVSWSTSISRAGSNDFPPLRTSETVVAPNLPVQFTSFVGRGAEMNDVRQILADNRLVTLTGAGGVGKTRLAVQLGPRSPVDSAAGCGWSIWRRSPIPIWCRSR